VLGWRILRFGWLAFWRVDAPTAWHRREKIMNVALKYGLRQGNAYGAGSQLMSNGKIFAIWETAPAAFLALQKHKPQFKLIMKYSTRAQAEAERQKLQN
jgi:hypothetical protein